MSNDEVVDAVDAVGDAVEYTDVPLMMGQPSFIMLSHHSSTKPSIIV